jgi:hypothetical protein
VRFVSYENYYRPLFSGEAASACGFSTFAKTDVWYFFWQKIFRRRAYRIGKQALSDGWRDKINACPRQG